MVDWWEALSAVQRIFGLVAIPATVVLVVQTILVIFGFGETNTDMDADFDLSTDMDDPISSASGVGTGFALFTVRGVVAFFAVGGWTGVVSDHAGLPIIVSIVLALASGSLALWFVGVLMRMTSKLQERGNVNLKNAVGKPAKVYMTVPESGKVGKVTLIIQGRYSECDAITHSGKTFKRGEQVMVTGIVDHSTLIVSSLNDSLEEDVKMSDNQQVKK